MAEIFPGCLQAQFCCAFSGSALVFFILYMVAFVCISLSTQLRRDRRELLGPTAWEVTGTWFGLDAWCYSCSKQDDAYSVNGKGLSRAE